MTFLPRRQFMLGSVGLLSFLALPRPLLAAVDPITALQAVAAAVAIIKGVLSALQSSDPQRDPILEQIDKKLDIVIANQERILAELIALRFYFDASVERGFRDHTIFEITSEKSRYDILQADRNVTQDEYLRLLGEVEQSTLLIGGYDIGAFVSFAAGAGLALTLYARLNRPARSVVAKAKFVEIIDNWLDPNNARSITSLIANTQSELTRRRAALDALPPFIDLGYVQRGGGSNRVCTVADRLYIDGNYDTGYSGRRIAVETECHTVEREPGPGHPCHRDFCNITAEVESMATALKNKLAGLPLPRPAASPNAALPPRPIPEFVHSDYGPVNDRNSERIAIAQLYNALAAQDLVREQMVAVRDALKQ
jgi:hypothetical protein